MNTWILEMVEKNVESLPYRTMNKTIYEGFKTRIAAEEFYIEKHLANENNNTEFLAFVVAPWGDVFTVDMFGKAPLSLRQYLIDALDTLKVV